MVLNQNDIEELIQLAESAALKAGLMIRQSSNEKFHILKKQGGSSLASQVLTEVDLKSQEIIRYALSASLEKYDLGWLGEESDDDNSRFEKDYFWCVDPLDGTLPFTEGYPGYAVSIALVAKNGTSRLGVVYDPVREELYSSNSKVKGLSETNTLNFFCDRSFIEHPFFKKTLNKLESYCKQKGYSNLEVHPKAGAVINAIGVMQNSPSCYFKFPKENQGGGSIWDYAATASIGINSGVCISSINGQALHLNANDSTYMNKQGILYASDKELANYIIQMYQQLSGQ